MSNDALKLDNVDLNFLDSLQMLRAELAGKYLNNQLDSYSLYVYGIVLAKLKLVDEATSALVESIKKRPTLWCAWLELSTLVKSVDVLNSLCNGNSSLPPHWMKDLFAAHCYMELSLSDEALNIYNAYTSKEGQQCKQEFECLRRQDPYNLDYMDIYSNILFVLEQYAHLAVLAQEACEIDKYRPESCCIIGNYYSLQNEHHKAVNYFQRALKLNPSYLQAWILMGHEFIELKNSTSAIQSYTNAIELNAKDYRAWYGLGQTYEILKLFSYALYYYKQAYLLRSNDSRFIVALGDIYAKLEKWDEAKRCYIKAYSVGDYEGVSLCKLAKVYEKLNEPINVAIVYDQFTEDQKLMRRTNSCTLNELCQAYKYLANFYLKKMKLDNAYDAAFKCLEFPETRAEAQSILNQITQSRTAQQHQQQIQQQLQQTNLQATASVTNVIVTAPTTSASANANLSSEMDTGGAVGSNDPVMSALTAESSLSLGESQQQQQQQTEKQSTAQSEAPLRENSGDSDSEEDQLYTSFNIKRFSAKSNRD